MSDTYYKPLKIAENIYHIYEPGNVYTTLIIGEEKALLIDTGYGFGDLAAFVRTLTDKPLEVVLTHGHTDHIIGAIWIIRKYAALMNDGKYEGEFNIYGHNEVVNILNTLSKMMLTKKLLKFYIHSYNI